jgi:hypothetical protein
VKIETLVSLGAIHEPRYCIAPSVHGGSAPEFRFHRCRTIFFQELPPEIQLHVSNGDGLSTLARERLLDALSTHNETTTPRGDAPAELIGKGMPDKKS